MRTPILFILAFALSFSTAHAALTMQVDFDGHFEPAANTTPRSRPDIHRSTTVTLEDQRIVVAGPDETTIFDFATRRRHVIDRKTATRVEYSLYDALGFRLLEYRNRIALARGLAAAKLDDGTTVVDHEQALSFQEKPSTPLQVADDGTDRTFSDDGRVLFRASLATTPVAPGQARMFAQMLRYAHGGHPQVLASLAASNAIPDRLVFVTRHFGTETTSIAVRSIRESTDPPIDPSLVPQRAAAADADPVDRTLDRAAALTAADLAATKRRTLADLAAALDERRALDATLAILEWSYMTGDPLPPPTSEQREMLGADPLVARLRGALAATTKDQIAAALPVFEQLRPAATTKAYVIDVFVANDRKTLGQADAARALFVKVLAANPELASVYKDLGDALMMAYDTPRAWRCWDEGRRLFPQFVNFRAVEQFEKSLASAHPEYF